jgi:hypothetical protein
MNKISDGKLMSASTRSIMQTMELTAMLRDQLLSLKYLTLTSKRKKNRPQLRRNSELMEIKTFNQLSKKLKNS